jgi:acyl dehydratase
MAVPVRHVLRQGANLGALVTAARIAFKSKGAKGGAFDAPGPLLERTIAPPPADLVADYVRHVGGSPASYKGTVPAHFFPYWAFPLLSRTLEGLPWDLSKALNGGCTLHLNAPLPAKGPWRLTAQLASVDADERRVLLVQRVTTGPVSEPEAVVAEMRVLIPLARPAKGERKAPPQVVPADAREVDAWRLSATAGRDFAVLTGDFNPIHWIPPAARAAGFRNVILHGFSTFARTIESLNQNVFAGRVDALASVDARFARPVVLPTRLALFVGHGHDLYVGKAPGAPANLVGSYRPKDLPETRT